MGDVGQYNTSFPGAIPGGKRAATNPAGGVALPGAARKKAQQLRTRRVKKRTGYAYEPVGKPLPPKQRSTKRSKLFVGTRGGKSSTADAKYQRALAAEVKRNLALVPKVKKGKESKLSSLGRSAAGKAASVVAGALGRSLFGSAGRAGAKTRAANAQKVLKAGRAILATPAGKAAIAGAIAYGVTRASPLGGRAGDAIVAAYYRKKDKSADARLRAFRAAVAAERAQPGGISSARVRELALHFGFTG